MVSNMSSSNWRTPSSTLSTFSEVTLSFALGAAMMGSMAMNLRIRRLVATSLPQVASPAKEANALSTRIDWPCGFPS